MSGACRWKILLTICTKQNRKVVAVFVSSGLSHTTDVHLFNPGKAVRFTKCTTRICVCHAESSCVSVASVEYNVVANFGIVFNVSVLGLVMLLLRAPEGYEDENGFHFGVLPDPALL
jgi:hypothetical protein